MKFEVTNWDTSYPHGSHKIPVLYFSQWEDKNVKSTLMRQKYRRIGDMLCSTLPNTEYKTAGMKKEVQES